MPERIWGFSKIVSFKTNNVNAQILGFLLNVLSSYAKIRVPDPLLVLMRFIFFSCIFMDASMKSMRHPNHLLLIKKHEFSW